MSNELSAEEIRELRELRDQLKRQQLQEDREPRRLPNEIFLELEETPSSQLKNKLKQFARITPRFEGDSWTKTGAANKGCLQDLKRYKIDALQQINAITKGADRLRTAARGATDLYQDLQQIFEEGGDENSMDIILEKTRRLSIYCWATGKELDKDAKQVNLRAIQLPSNLKYLEEDDDDDENKEYFINNEIMEKINKAKYENAVVRRATGGEYKRHTYGGNYKTKKKFLGKSHFRQRPPPPAPRQEQHPGHSKDQ